LFYNLIKLNMEDIKIGLNTSVKAVMSHFQAQRDLAISDLEIYLNRPVGIGEHVNVTADIITIFERLEKANSMLDMLNRMVVNNTNVNQQEQQ
jgi:hypothetical protein